MMWKWAFAEEVPFELPDPPGSAPACKPAARSTGSSDPALRKPALDVAGTWCVQQGLTRLTSVAAEEDRHEKVDHDAVMAGRMYLTGAYKGEELKRALTSCHQVCRNILARS